MIYNNIDYVDLFKSDINLFLKKVMENNLFSFNSMSYSGTDLIEVINSEIDINKLQLVIHREKFNLVIQNLIGHRIEFNRNPLIKRKIGIGLIEKNNEISNNVFKHFGFNNLQYAKREHCDFVGWDKTLDYDFWIYKKRPIPQPMEYFPVFDFNNPNKKELSIEHIPGHTHYMRQDDELIFEAAWQMYFGEVYYKYIPKPLFDDFSDCSENIILESGIRRITLYEDPNAFNDPKNIEKIWLFRRKLGIDSIAHELTRGKNRIEPINLPVLITKKNCEKGQTRVTRYLDSKDNLTDSNLAVKKEIKEYLDDGITVVFEKTETV